MAPQGRRTRRARAPPVPRREVRDHSKVACLMSRRRPFFRDGRRLTSEARRFYESVVRRTINIDDDVAAAIERLRRERGMWISQAVNLLGRAGLSRATARRRFRQRSAKIGLID